MTSEVGKIPEFRKIPEKSHACIRHTFDECCPNEKIKINYKNRHVWIDKNMKSDIEKREKLFKLKLKEPTEENNI